MVNTNVTIVKRITKLKVALISCIRELLRVFGRRNVLEQALKGKDWQRTMIKMD
ncbi:hypothetical protein L484_013439 [Morus notabilis]|uniref:Uncharacterized protein n=1 Tax=Morus notabilis TaxID=981085 RepID=W9RAI9_9ROSA|nr:hypothetical protein L484_013439 [Morus notabilis]